MAKIFPKILILLKFFLHSMLSKQHVIQNQRSDNVTGYIQHYYDIVYCLM